MIKLIQLDGVSKYKDICKKIYEESFPVYERWNFEEIILRQKESSCRVYAVLDDDKVIGIYVPWHFGTFIFIEYIAIDKYSRGKNYGSIVLKEILDSAKKMIVIEVEPKESNDMAKKRIEWYERFGFIMSDEKYAMPSLENLENLTFVNMKIMSTRSISKEEFLNIKNTLYKEIYKIDKRINNI